MRKEAWIYLLEDAFGNNFVSYETIKCIVVYGDTSETRWRRPSFCALNASSPVYPGL